MKITMRCIALYSMLILAAGAAHAGYTPMSKTCPGGSQLTWYYGLDPEPACPAQTSSTQAVSDATLTGALSNLGSTIGGVVSGALGGGFGGGFANAFGVLRTAIGGKGETGQAAAAGGARWNVWGALSRVESGISFQPVQSGGHTDIVLGGLDYTFGDVVAGVALSGERTRIATSFNGGSVSGDGNTLAPYLGWRINRSWLLDASLGVGTTRLSSVDNSAGGVTGSNRVDRTMATLGLTYGMTAGSWLLTGKGSVLAIENRYSAYTQSNNTFVAGTSSHLTQLRLGGQAAYNAGSVVPYVGLTYIYDVQRPTIGAVGGQTPANDRDAWQVKVGLNFRGTGAVYGGVSVSSDLGRSQIKNDQFLANIGLRF